jgi:hypothetical protein
MAEQTIVGYDMNTPNADGTDNVTTALRELLNKYPGLLEDNEITYGVLEDTKGIAMFPTGNAAILSESEDVTGHITQQCSYSFIVVYRTKATASNQDRKADKKEWLDNLGRWLELQQVTINKEVYRLSSYPALTGEREFKKIHRASQSYLSDVADDKTEDWAIQMQALYRNEFDR